VYSKSKLVSQGIQNHSQNDGKIRWVDGWGEIIFDDEANELSMIGVIQDTLIANYLLRKYKMLKHARTVYLNHPKKEF
jgi:hypothetical protein